MWALVRVKGSNKLFVGGDGVFFDFWSFVSHKVHMSFPMLIRRSRRPFPHFFLVFVVLLLECFVCCAAAAGGALGVN